MGGSPARRFEALRRKFPAMNVAEALIWREWLKLHESEWEVLPESWVAFREKGLADPPLRGDVFDYNFRLGPGRDPGPETAPNLRKQAILSSQLRVDVVGFQAGVPEIFEVRRRITPAEFGQVAAYEAHWLEDKIPTPPPKLHLVGQTFTANVLPLLRKLGIPLDLVTVDLSVLSPKSTVTG